MKRVLVAYVLRCFSDGMEEAHPSGCDGGFSGGRDPGSDLDCTSDDDWGAVAGGRSPCQGPGWGPDGVGKYCGGCVVVRGEQKEPQGDTAARPELGRVFAASPKMV
jgi:hypothetical protein